MGRLCGYILTAKPRPPPIKGDSKEEVAKEESKRKEEESLLSSEIWRTLFRGGCMVKKLTHSLSGTYVSAGIEGLGDSLLSGIRFHIVVIIINLHVFVVVVVVVIIVIIVC